MKKKRKSALIIMTPKDFDYNKQVTTIWTFMPYCSHDEVPINTWNHAHRSTFLWHSIVSQSLTKWKQKTVNCKKILCIVHNVSSK